MAERRRTSVTHVGNIAIGGDNPIRIQSMATTDTNDTEASVAQAKRIIDAGGELVRFTTQGKREAENMKNISERLKADGYDTPLVADVHFTAHTADVAIERTLVPFLNICKEHHTAVRIGVNHGSLSDRIMSRYGDTPEGIVESCMEFLRICRRENFNDIVISIKASNTVVMVTTVRLLVETMDKEDMHFPLHLGVTEAGEGEDGRIKSAVGIGALLTEGIGDTIRVSLSEEPEAEIPVARRLVELIPECTALRENAVIKDDTLYLDINADTWEDLQLKASMAAGAILIDKKAHNLVISCPACNDAKTAPTSQQLTDLQDSILQAARIKFTKTEYISCPGCGRTLYDLRTTIARIKEATRGMTGLKIGIMGCIVNGPGEMADADYGYVGAGRGKISLYKNKECVLKNIPEEEAVERLLELIKSDGKA